MRFPTIAAAILAAALILGGTARIAFAEGPASAPAARAAERAEPGGDAAGVWGLYAALGAMVGYMYAANPVITTAVTTAVIGGATTLWAYDYFMGKPVPATAE